MHLTLIVDDLIERLSESVEQVRGIEFGISLLQFNYLQLEKKKQNIDAQTWNLKVSRNLSKIVWLRKGDIMHAMNFKNFWLLTVHYCRILYSRNRSLTNLTVKLNRN